MSEIRREFEKFVECEACNDRERRLMRISAKWMTEKLAKHLEEI